MKKLIDITDEHLLDVVNKIYILTENKIQERKGLFDLSFEDSYRKYGEAKIIIEKTSNDNFDGYWTSVSQSEFVIKHDTCWFAELQPDGDASNYNKNHFCGYLRLQELGYNIPTKAVL